LVINSKTQIQNSIYKYNFIQKTKEHQLAAIIGSADVLLNAPTWVITGRVAKIMQIANVGTNKTFTYSKSVQYNFDIIANVISTTRRVQKLICFSILSK
jgi:hypothetical protein